MINENFVYLGAAIFIFGSFDYFLATIKGTVKPNRVTWFIWAVVPLIAFVAQLGEKVNIHQALLTFTIGFVPLLILIASFLNKNSYWKISKRDAVCGILSLCGIGAWLLTGKGLYAIYFAIASDGLAALPTIIKAFKFPETEKWTIYFFNAISAVITLLTITTWNVETFGFPLYSFLVTIVLTVLIKGRIGPRLFNTH